MKERLRIRTNRFDELFHQIVNNNPLGDTVRDSTVNLEHLDIQGSMKKFTDCRFIEKNEKLDQVDSNFLIIFSIFYLKAKPLCALKSKFRYGKLSRWYKNLSNLNVQ